MKDHAHELRAQAQKIEHEAKAILDSMVEADESRAAELNSQFDAAMAKADGLEAQAKRYEDLAAREEARSAVERSARPSEDRSVQAVNAPKSLEQRHAEAFYAYARSGLDDLTSEQRAALREVRDQNVGTPAKGGYLVPTELQTTLIKALKAYGPLNDGSVVTYRDTDGGNPIVFPKMDDTANMGRMIGEAVQVNTNSTVGFSTLTMNAFKATTDVVLISSELLADAAINPAEVIAEALAERMGRLVNNQCTLGAGGGTAPTGIMTALAAGTPVVSNAVNKIDYSDIIELIHSIDPAYRNGPKVGFMFNDAVLKALRKLNDAQGRPLWEPSYLAGAPATFAGYSYAINQDMAAPATGNLSVAFGDLSKFVVRRVKDFALKRLDERYADYDQTAFLGFCRFDSALLDSRAINALKVK